MRALINCIFRKTKIKAQTSFVFKTSEVLDLLLKYTNNFAHLLRSAIALSLHKSPLPHRLSQSPT